MLKWSALMEQRVSVDSCAFAYFRSAGVDSVISLAFACGLICSKIQWWGNISFVCF